jgi:hypothetical protein
MITVKCKPDHPGPDGTSFKDNRSLPIHYHSFIQLILQHYYVKGTSIERVAECKREM